VARPRLDHVELAGQMPDLPRRVARRLLVRQASRTLLRVAILEVLGDLFRDVVPITHAPLR
jgi:hypothetical protein